MVSDIEKAEQAGVNHILMSYTGEARGWMVSVGKRGEKGYTVVHHKTPEMALFIALRQMGVVTDGQYEHPDPFIRLRNAVDRNIIARWTLTPTHAEEGEDS